jgi:hypothetical protein
VVPRGESDIKRVTSTGLLSVNIVEKARECPLAFSPIDDYPVGLVCHALFSLQDRLSGSETHLTRYLTSHER